MLYTLIENFLYDAMRGKSKLSPDIINEFKEACGKALEKQFNEEIKWKIRMSGLGKPLCQQQLEKKGKEKELQYNTIIKFLMGDLLEAVSIAVMKGAGINIEKTQEPVKLKIGGIELSGTYDVKIDGKVWDIKSASPSSFISKFGEFGSYNKIKNDDPFGYVMQGHLYGESDNVPFGGWIAVNKVTGEFAVCEAPENQEEDRKDVLQTASKNIKVLQSNRKFKKLFHEIQETYVPKSGKQKGTRIETGNTILESICGYCDFRKHCWPKAVLHEKVISKAKSKPLVWYNKLKNVEIKNL
tara:strand:- start:206 stop:1099 length:894 start_codon:yes stop_codon:yes gene_type:complete